MKLKLDADKTGVSGIMAYGTVYTFEVRAVNSFQPEQPRGPSLGGHRPSQAHQSHRNRGLPRSPPSIGTTRTIPPSQAGATSRRNPSTA